jgi:sarcosine oxidase gamma subunit
VSLAFLTPTTAHGGPPPVSPMAAPARRAGARLDVRDGWLVPVAFDVPAATGTVAFADASALAKTELRGPADALAAAAGSELAPGVATVRGGVWWCPLTPERVLVLGPVGDAEGLASVDVTAQFCGLRLRGPLARELTARFCALDLRASAAPPGSVRPGSIARTPGLAVVEDVQTLLLLVGAALAEYFWTVVADAAARLGGGPAGVDALRTAEEAARA